MLTTNIPARTLETAVWGTYDVLAGVLAVNIACYELLDKPVSNRLKVGRTICCGLKWVLWTARAT